MVHDAHGGGGHGELEAEFSGFGEGVFEVLGHERGLEIRGVIAGGHARGHGLDERTAGRAGGEDFESAGAVEAAFFNQGQGFAERDDLDAAHEVVDEFEQCAAADRTDVRDATAHGGEDGAGDFEGSRAAADEEVQFAGGRVGFAARDGGVEQFATGGGGSSVQLTHPTGGERAAINEQSAAQSAGQRTIFAQPHLTGRGVIRDHANDDVGALRRYAGRIGDTRAGGRERFGLVRAEVEEQRLKFVSRIRSAMWSP